MRWSIAPQRVHDGDRIPDVVVSAANQQVQRPASRFPHTPADFSHPLCLRTGHLRSYGPEFWNRCASKVAERNRLPAASLERRRAGSALGPEEFTVTLLKWALLFFVISVVAGILGFTGVSAASADIARILFYVFLVIFLVLLILGLTIFRV